MFDIYQGKFMYCKTTANLCARSELGLNFKDGYDKEQSVEFSVFLPP